MPVKQMAALRGRVLEMDSGHGASTWIWFDRPVVARARLSFRAAGETKTIVEVGAGGIVFTGKAGAVRASRSRLAVCTNAGSACCA